MVRAANKYETREPFWVGNHPGLDLVNTLAVDAGGEPLELVSDWDALLAWAEAAGLIDAALEQRCRAVPEQQGRSAVAWFRRLRTSLREVLESDDDPAAVKAFDTALAVVPVRLCYRLTQPRHMSPLEAAGPLDELRLALALAAVDAAQLDRSRVRRCGNHRCVLLYVDTTKNRSRRWCDMAVCGNRAKAHAHYQRLRIASTS